MSDFNTVFLNPLATFDIDTNNVLICYTNSIALGKPSRINRKFLLAEKTYCWVLRSQFTKWIDALIFSMKVLMGIELIDNHSIIVQNCDKVKIVCSFEENGITIKTNKEDISFLISLTPEIIIRLLEGFSSLFLVPFCCDLLIAFKIFNFVKYYAHNAFDLNDENLLWDCLRKVYQQESEEFCSEIALNIRLLKEEFMASSKAFFFSQQFI